MYKIETDQIAKWLLDMKSAYKYIYICSYSQIQTKTLQITNKEKQFFVQFDYLSKHSIDCYWCLEGEENTDLSQL